MQVTGCWWIYVLKKTTTTKHNKLHLTSLIIMLFYIYGSEIFPVDFISQVLFRAAKNEVKLLIMFAVLNLYGSSYRKKKLKKKKGYYKCSCFGRESCQKIQEIFTAQDKLNWHLPDLHVPQRI